MLVVFVEVAIGLRSFAGNKSPAVKVYITNRDTSERLLHATRLGLLKENSNSLPYHVPNVNPVRYWFQ